MRTKKQSSDLDRWSLFLKVGLLFICAFMIMGCTSDFYALHYLKHCPYGVLMGERRSLVEGPYEWIEALSPNSFLAKRDGKEIIIVARGCLPTGIEEFDNDAWAAFSMPMSQGAFLLKGSIKQIGTNKISAVIYEAASQYYVGTDENGKQYFNNESYVSAQLGILVFGSSRLDHTDTDNPLYEEFSKAEAIAKKYKLGYWGRIEKTKKNIR
jgi:hypothetical protein